MSLIYRGTSSDDVHFNVTERRVYNAPAFDVSGIEVPGRSGDILNSQERFKNKAIVYTGFIRSSDFPGDTTWERLSRGLRTIKAWACGDAGKYHDLTDDYDPGFVRRAFVSGETAISEVLDRPDGATITITFMAEPFMYEESDPIELPETGTASGAIASFEGVAAPLQSLVFSIEPSQNLNGYDYPWPAGGGVNKFDGSAVTTTHSSNWGIDWNATTNVLTITQKTSYTTGTPTFSLNLPSGTYVASYQSISETGKISLYTDGSWVKSLNNGVTFTIDSTKTNEIRFAAVTVTKFQVESGSSATSFSPYSNICPISGWTQVDGVHTGDNAVFPSDFEQGSLSGSGTPSSSAIRIRSKYVEVEPNTTYAFKIGDGLSLYEFHEYGALPNRSFIKYTTINAGNGTVTTSATTHFVRLLLRYPNNASVTPSALKAIRMCKGDNADYTPITIALGQTVYGGTVDAVSGKLVVDRAMVTFDGTESGWSKSGSALNGYYKGMTGSPYYAKANTAFISDKFSYTADRNTYFATYGKCYCDTAFNFNVDPTVIGGNTLALWKTWLAANPLQVVYELATPIEVDLTPVSGVSSVLGQNNVWCNTGNTEVVYVEPTENPTEWPSKPRLEITMAGAGTLTVNGKTWSIGAYTGTLICDSEIMDWYDASNLKNSLVSGDGFPELQPGENVITYTGGITKVVAKPRWRTL